MAPSHRSQYLSPFALSFLSPLSISRPDQRGPLSYISFSLSLRSPFSLASSYLSPASAWRPLIDLYLSLSSLSLPSLLFLSLARISVAPGGGPDQAGRGLEGGRSERRAAGRSGRRRHRGGAKRVQSCGERTAERRSGLFFPVRSPA